MLYIIVRSDWSKCINTRTNKTSIFLSTTSLCPQAVSVILSRPSMYGVGESMAVQWEHDGMSHGCHCHCLYSLTLHISVLNSKRNIYIHLFQIPSYPLDQQCDEKQTKLCWLAYYLNHCNVHESHDWSLSSVIAPYLWSRLVSLWLYCSRKFGAFLYCTSAVHHPPLCVMIGWDNDIYILPRAVGSLCSGDW